MTESYIKTGAGGTAFVGPDAVRLYQAVTLRSALELLSKGIKPSRGWTMTAALKAATAITGKPYPSTGRSRRLAVEDARADLKLWCNEMAAALPREGDE